MPRKFDLDSFLKESKKIHNDKYDYSLVKYEGCRINIRIKCPVHGVFEQRPNHHIDGRGCSKCRNDKIKSILLLDTSQFIIKAKNIHGDNYDYSLVNYINGKSDIKIICLIHGIFKQRPSHHLSGHGCRKCSTFKNSNTRRITTDQFITKAKNVHGDNYDYSSVKYKNMHSNVVIICSDHGLFKQQPANHLVGKGCPKCSKYGFNPLDSGYLYVLESLCGAYVKVGITNKIEQRHGQLKSNTPFNFKAIRQYLLPGIVARDIETKLKRDLNPANFVGFDGATEWFRNGGEVLDIIDVRLKLYYSE